MFGVILVTQAMLPLLREAPAGRIVNVSSEVGSLTMATDPANPHYSIINASYVPSKSALNAITVAFAKELQSTRIKVNAACPGFTATDLNQFRGTRTVEQGAWSPCASRSSTRTDRPAASRTRAAGCPGEPGREHEVRLEPVGSGDRRAAPPSAPSLRAKNGPARPASVRCARVAGQRDGERRARLRGQMQ